MFGLDIKENQIKWSIIYFRKIVLIFYIILVSICTIAQTAMSIKKKIEARRDRIAIGNSNNQEAGINTISTSCINNQRLNQYLCTTPGMLLLLLILVIVGFAHMVLFYDFF